MRKKWFAFGCLSSIIIFVILMIAIGASLARLGKKPKRMNPNTYLELKISGELTEYNEIKDSFSFDFLGESKMATHDIVQKINSATHDPSVRGIIIEPFFISSGFANLNEIKNSIKKFKESGKSVYSFLELAGNKDYFLASEASEIYLNPSASAGLFLTGVGTNILFYKDILDKIGVEMNVIHAGKYKGFGETYVRNSFSEPVRENIHQLFGQIYEKMLFDLSESRNISYDEIKNIYEQRKELFINKDAALNYKLVDKLSFKEDMLTELNIKENQLLCMSKYKAKSNKTSKNRIAVIYAQGSITKQGSSQQTIISAKRMGKIIEKIQKDNTIKAVVIRVNSPGGSALESEIILDKIAKLKAKIPIIISMGNVAASGGYYIASNANHIFADPYTITGSIGVVGMFANLEDLSDKIGINSEKLSYGKYSNAFDIWEKPNDDFLKSMQNGIDQTYIEFKQRVSDGREIAFEDVEDIAQGQVWSCEMAIAKKLVDEKGLLQDAVKKASEIAQIPSYMIEYFPKQKTMTDILLEKFDIEIISDIVIDNKILKIREIKKATLMLQNIEDEPIQARMPFMLNK
ncbi:MAG: signal peptide peptidase SppA [Candidatus Cloacimonetes bacterium]|nr:signal peptide peptidase SppA [Candidatus Cloacimonadota bacterium]